MMTWLCSGKKTCKSSGELEHCAQWCCATWTHFTLYKLQLLLRSCTDKLSQLHERFTSWVVAVVAGLKWAITQNYSHFLSDECEISSFYFVDIQYNANCNQSSTNGANTPDQTSTIESRFDYWIELFSHISCINWSSSVACMHELGEIAEQKKGVYLNTSEIQREKLVSLKVGNVDEMRWGKFSHISTKDCSEGWKRRPEMFDWKLFNTLKLSFVVFVNSSRLLFSSTQSSYLLRLLLDFQTQTSSMMIHNTIWTSREIKL